MVWCGTCVVHCRRNCNSAGIIPSSTSVFVWSSRQTLSDTSQLSTLGIRVQNCDSSFTGSMTVGHAFSTLQHLWWKLKGQQLKLVGPWWLSNGTYAFTFGAIVTPLHSALPHRHYGWYSAYKSSVTAVAMSSRQHFDWMSLWYCTIGQMGVGVINGTGKASHKWVAVGSRNHIPVMIFICRYVPISNL